MTNRKGFECEHSANEFARKVKGTVKFSPLPDYMGMIPYWVVTWEKNNFVGSYSGYIEYKAIAVL